MAAPSTPSNVVVSQGDGHVLIASDFATGATTYPIQRSTDNVTFTPLATPAVPEYVDTTATVGTAYWYQMAAANGSGTSAYSSSLKAVPCMTGQFSLYELRLRSQQRADMVNNPFVSRSEWGSYINASAKELYDLLITAYEDYFVAPRVSFTTDGSASYALPNGVNYSAAPAFYKIYGVDLGISASTSAWATLKKFNFIDRNRYVFPQLGANLVGQRPEYRVMGSNIQLIPANASLQIGLWYFPRLLTLLQDTDILDGFSGWEEYIVIDAAIKALRKEESDTSELMNEKMAIKERIEGVAQNRDAGQADTISDVRGNTSTYGFGGEPFGGY